VLAEQMYCYVRDAKSLLAMHTLKIFNTFWIFEFYTIICSHSYVSVVWGISEAFGGIQ
jgi:hypothetical protein